MKDYSLMPWLRNIMYPHSPDIGILRFFLKNVDSLLKKTENLAMNQHSVRK